MILGARFLANVCSVNAYDLVDRVEITEGEAVNVYLQLVDTTKFKASQGYNPSGLRYVPTSGSTLELRVDNLDAAKTITRFATQPYPTTDPSIWCLAILASDGLHGGTAGLKLVLSYGSVTIRGVVQGAFRIYSQDVSG